MKIKSAILLGLFLSTLAIFLTSFLIKTTSSDSQTEEYAIVDVLQNGKRKFIRVTKGTEPTSEIEWKKEKTDLSDDFTPVIEVLNQLNAQGFELLNASLAYQTLSGSSLNYGDPRHTFMMVKKLK